MFQHIAATWRPEVGEENSDFVAQFWLLAPAVCVDAQLRDEKNHVLWEDYFGNHRNGVEGIPNTVLVSTSLLQEVTYSLVNSLVDLFFM